MNRKKQGAKRIVAAAQGSNAPQPMDLEICQHILNRILSCQLQHCRMSQNQNLCDNLLVLKAHLGECKDCTAVELIDHARYCNRPQCHVTSCIQIREKFRNFSPDSCMHMTVSTLQNALLFDNDANDYKIFTQELMKLNACEENDSSTSSSDSETEEFPPSKRRILVVKPEALNYWIHVHECQVPNCPYSVDSTSCQRKKLVIKLHRCYCTYQTCKNCMLIYKFIIRHTKTCDKQVCPVPRCDDIRSRDKKKNEPSQSTSGGGGHPKYRFLKI